MALLIHSVQSIHKLYVHTDGHVRKFDKVSDLLHFVPGLYIVYYSGAHLVCLYTWHA